ncbi:DUF6493 family protein [Rhizohabitans arisaemae]|uniref:DUF6493 family protein n=1 Tax=Rhizohabitans arisaemae TaxID=2720610 RepID=UPI0024B197F2|nr:DUF6493 family protein [Rhizohabitans arisaemae]
MTAWETVRDLINRKAADEVAAFTAGLGDAERREIAKNLPGHLPVLPSLDPDWQPWHNLIRYGPALRAAGAATIGGTAALVTWLYRRDHTPGGTEHESERVRLLEILAARPAEWQADLARRLSLKIRRADSWGVGVTLGLLRRTGIEPPAHDPLIVGWVATTTPAEEATEPGSLLDRMLPRIFEAEGVGRQLQWAKPDDPWIAGLAAEATPARRETLLRGCVGRFLRGGSPIDLRYFGRLHEALRPTPEEIAPRARDYVRLLPAAPGPIAELALNHLRRLDDLDPSELTEALEGLLFRVERGLAESGLMWLEESVRRRPGPADELAPALTLAFGHKTFEVRQRAVRIALKLAPRLSRAGATTIGEAVSALPPRLGSTLAAAFGGEVAEAEEVFDDFVPGTLPGPIRPRPFPAPLKSAREIADLFANHADDNPRRVERILAALVTLDIDRDRLATDLITEYLRRPGTLRNTLGTWIDPLRGMFHPSGGEPSAAVRPLPTAPPPSFADLLPAPDKVPTPQWITLNRCAELFDALIAGNPPPVLLATPTREDGLLDPGVFVDRLAVCEAAGTPPLPADFQQALLRVARTVPAEVQEKAATLTSPEGRQAARWLAEGGLPDPKVTVEWSRVHPRLFLPQWLAERGPVEGRADRDSGGSPPGAPDQAPNPGNSGTLRPTAVVDAPMTGYPLIDGILTNLSTRVNPWLVEDFSPVLPNHRELSAAHLLALVRASRYDPVASSTKRLITTDGPAGAALSAVLAQDTLLFGHDHTSAPVLQLIAGDELPLDELAVQFAQRIKNTGDSIKKLSDALEHFARNGAHHQMWTVTETALRLLLPAEKEKARTGLIYLITFAAMLARWTDTRAEIPELTALAARKGDTKLLREARTLRAYLIRP